MHQSKNTALLTKLGAETVSLDLEKSETISQAFSGVNMKNFNTFYLNHIKKKKLINIIKGIQRGKFSPIFTHVADILERQPIPFEQYAYDHKDFWQ